MQKLILTYEVTSTDTYWSVVTLPLLYSSPEAALVDLESMVKNLQSNIHNEFSLGNLKLYASDFYDHHGFNLPDILTFEEWFDKFQ